MDRRVAVTGGAGFIGANLCRRLVNDPAVDSVVVIDDLSTGFERNLDGLPVELVVGDIRDPEALDEVFADATNVVHLAARGSVSRSIDDPTGTYSINATGTVEVAEAARRNDVGQVIFSSSSSVYGSNPAMPKHEQQDARPMSPYAVSKLAAEQWILSYGKVYGLKTLTFRFFNVFGPLQTAGHVYAAVIPQFIGAAVLGEPLVVHGDGLQSRDFTYVDTVTDVIAQAIVAETTHDGPVNLALGGRIDLNTLIGHIRDLVDQPLVVDHRDARPGDVRHSQADPTTLESLFPDTPVVDLVEGIRRTMDWYLDVGRAFDPREASRAEQSA